ncbi:MAG TPA: hypothetical protein VGR21_13565 [Cryptosporangiaceae bacterium]|nr:hypothetical protein [Cryptosporangiaceae bacterium]
MSADKLSISLDSELAAAVRAAAAGQGVTVSTWLADAAESRVRQQNLREALDELAAEIGGLDAEELDRLVTAARRTSTVVTGAQGGA